MASALEHHHSIATELRRSTRKELEAAIEHLARPKLGAEDVHDVRTSVKRVRAVVRLLQHALGADYADANDRLRAAGRRLSQVRDADAAIETFESLRVRYRQAISPAVARGVMRGLELRRRAARAGTVERVRQARRRLRRILKRLPDRIGDAARFSVVRTGITRGYRRARSAMSPLTIESDAVDFHRWRRRVKDHWYQVRLFEGLHPALRARVRSLRRLETALGDDHNLAMLAAQLRAEPDRFGGARGAAVALGCIEKRQHTLRRTALRHGERLFDAAPRKLRSSIADWWGAKRQR